MEDLQAMHTAMSNPTHHRATKHDDWENWTDDDDEPITPVIKEASLVQLGLTTNVPSAKSYNPSATRRSRTTRQSNPKIQRLKSRKRQKYQNEKAGIKLVTDLTRFRKGPQHIAQLVRPVPAAMPNETAVKFVDPGALRALEGSPNSASMGNWAWLKGGQSPSTTASPSTHHHSPDGSKIVIGISMPEDEGRMISPQTAVVATPLDRFPVPPTSTQPIHTQPTSTWSPDTEDGFSPARYNIYAQATGQVPPVPTVPSPFKNPTKARLSRGEIDDDDDFTPVTLFEEDGKSPTSAASKVSPETIQSRSGWWDHVKTPFRERFSPTSKSEKDAPGPIADEWWKSSDEKKTMNIAQQQQQHPSHTGSEASASTLRSIVPVIRIPTPTPPTTVSSSRSSPPIAEPRQESHTEKARVVMEENIDPSELPPPYERTPSTKEDAQAIRYRAVFPPGHPFATQFPPSPQPVSPGLEANMTSKGAIKMTDVPLTPATATAEPHTLPLPDRVAGTYVTGEQFLDVNGDSPAMQVEKTRRRHEKEDYLAHKVGGFWKGRGCLPEDGCYGRSGREGRQRRRIWLGVCIAFLLLTVLGVVLGVELSRRLHKTISQTSGSSPDTASGDGSSSDTGSASVWLNLTNFPPIPTGLATVVGADNSEEVTGCVTPASLWSCSLPPEQQAANEPQDANQPKFIFQIQYDASTRQLWDIPNGDAPTPDTAKAAVATSTSSSSSKSTTAATTTVASSVTSSAASATSTASTDEGGDLSKRDDTLYDTGIAPNPAPPSYDEMWFLGNWTDGIVSSEKAGEPTPFYISFFSSLNSTAGANELTDATNNNKKRGDIGSGSDNGENVTDTLPSPILNADGTGAAAQLHPFPYQQPLRLFDRGLPTEHYGFYSYFNKTIYVSSVDNTTTTTSSSDEDGGVLETSAAWYATWTQTRFIVKIWTNKGLGSSSRLIGSSGYAAGDNSSSPGSFPYPITVGEDTHGGDLTLKNSFAYGVEADQHVNTSEAVSFTNNIGYGSAVVNPRLPDGDLSFGGIDGGTGGCRCEWVNWVDSDGTTDGSLG